MPKLFPYQVDGARFLATKKRALLADEMGLGKSAQAISACAAVGAYSVLVVCPASVKENWRREFWRFWPSDKNCALTVESYDKTVRCGAFGGHEWDALVLDEAHYLKTRTAKRTRAILGDKCDGVGGLVERARHVFCLTGTPTPNNPSELWPLLRAVMPEALGPKPLTYFQFIHRHCVLRDTGFGIEIVKGRNLAELRDRIAPFVLRRKKADVLAELPPVRFDTLALDGEIVLPPDVLTIVHDVDRALAEHGIEGLAKLTPHVATLRRLTGIAKAAPVAAWVCDWLDSTDGKIVLFAHHREVIDILQGVFEATCVVVRGDTPAAKRQAAIDAFQRNGGPRVFLGQLQAAGTGVTLTAAADVVFVESSWVPAENEQAAMRVHRIGQRNACLIRFATLAGSIDERIQRAVMRKTADIVKLFG